VGTIIGVWVRIEDIADDVIGVAEAVFVSTARVKFALVCVWLRMFGLIV